MRAFGAGPSGLRPQGPFIASLSVWIDRETMEEEWRAKGPREALRP